METELRFEEEDEDEEAALQVCKRACALMLKHFESVQIFACRKESDGNTGRVNYGEGNFYSRYGMAKLWCKVQEGDDVG